MKNIRFSLLMNLALIALLLGSSRSLIGQSGATAVLDSALFEEQMQYLVDRTRVYDNFRAIRNDIFLKMKKNAIDSLNREKLEVARLNSVLAEKEFTIESLNSDLGRTKNERDDAIRNKDNLSFLGIAMQKAVYNTVMWILVLVLLGSGILLLLMFKRSHVITTQTKKELENIQEDYEEYRKSSREKYEKLVVNHHNEIMKLKR